MAGPPGREQSLVGEMVINRRPRRGRLEDRSGTGVLGDVAAVVEMLLAALCGIAF